MGEATRLKVESETFCLVVISEIPMSSGLLIQTNYHFRNTTIIECRFGQTKDNGVLKLVL